MTRGMNSLCTRPNRMSSYLRDITLAVPRSPAGRSSLPLRHPRSDRIFAEEVDQISRTWVYEFCGRGCGLPGAAISGPPLDGHSRRIASVQLPALRDRGARLPGGQPAGRLGQSLPIEISRIHDGEDRVAYGQSL